MPERGFGNVTLAAAMVTKSVSWKTQKHF